MLVPCVIAEPVVWPPAMRDFHPEAGAVVPAIALLLQSRPGTGVRAPLDGAVYESKTRSEVVGVVVATLTA